MTEPALARAKPLLGTMVEIRASHGDAIALQTAVTAAFDAVTRVHRLMSVHEPSSDLSRINAAPPTSAVIVSNETAEVLAFALALAGQSEGLFDPTMGGAHSARGWLPAPQRRPDADASWVDVELVANTVRCHRALLLDFGGIGKGYAVDCAMNVLLAAGCTHILINAGGDIRCHTPQAERIHARLADGSLVAALDLTDGAVASSCFAESTSTDETVISRLTNPNTRQAVMVNASIMVLAADCMTADALTKLVALALAPEQVTPLLQTYAAEALWLEPTIAGVKVQRLPACGSSEAHVQNP